MFIIIHHVCFKLIWINCISQICKSIETCEMYPKNCLLLSLLVVVVVVLLSSFKDTVCVLTICLLHCRLHTWYMLRFCVLQEMEMIHSRQNSFNLHYDKQGNSAIITLCSTSFVLHLYFIYKRCIVNEYSILITL